MGRPITTLRGLAKRLRAQAKWYDRCREDIELFDEPGRKSMTRVVELLVRAATARDAACQAEAAARAAKRGGR